MSLDVYLKQRQTVSVYDAGITHNLSEMAGKVKIGKLTLYQYLWHPEKINVTKAKQLIEPLQVGLDLLLKSPKKYAKYNPFNGWGCYEHLVSFVKQYLDACKEFPNAKVEVSR